VVEVVVSRLGLDSQSNSFVVILQERDGDRILPIWIGRAEAESIAAHLNGVHRERPMTHDLCQSLIVTLGGSLEAVHITQVKDNTFYAELHVVANGKTHVVDARPSDSIAIALRLSAPVFAADELLAEYDSHAATDDPAESSAADEPGPEPDLGVSNYESQMRSAEQLQQYLERLRPEDFGKFKP
jgi:bifunctional DNase/RNase